MSKVRRGTVSERARRGEAERVEAVRSELERPAPRMLAGPATVDGPVPWAVMADGEDLVVVEDGVEKYRRAMTAEELELVAGDDLSSYSIHSEDHPVEGVRFAVVPAVDLDVERYGAEIERVEPDPLEDSTDQGIELEGDPTS